MARQTPRRRMWTAVGLLFALSAITVGARGLQVWAPFARDPVAVLWPHNVRPLVDFIQGETQTKFIAPVKFVYVADAGGFSKRATPSLDPSAQTRADLRTAAAVGRALGFWSGNVDLLADTDLIRRASDFSSVWLRDENTVLVRASDAKAELSPVDRADLIVTLTEILDDQLYHIADRLGQAVDSQRFQSFAGIDLGEAVWMHDRYVRRFSAADKTAYDKASTAIGSTYASKVSSVPPAYRALRIAGQRLGPAFVGALHARGGNSFTRALTSDPPTALDQMEMPDAKYRQRDHVEHVDPPPVPTHATLLNHRQLGPFAVYLVLAAAMPPTDALVAADGWGNDSFTSYELDGRVCVDGRIVADTAADADHIARALETWGHARPSQSATLLGRKGTTLLLTACDPGTQVHQPIVAPVAIDQFFGRADVLVSEIERTHLPRRSECVAVSAFQRYSARDVRGANPAVDAAAILAAIAADCDASV